MDAIDFKLLELLQHNAEMTVQQLSADGADVVKVFASASIRDGGNRVMSDPQIKAACEEATAQGLRTTVHAYGTEVIRSVILAGCTSVEHGNHYDEEVIELLADYGTYITPQLALLYQNYFDNRERFLGIGNYTAAGFARMEEARERGIDTFIQTIENPAVNVVFGSDAVAGAHGQNVEELVARVEALGGGEAHVVGVQRIWHHQMRGVRNRAPKGQIIAVIIGII